MVQAILETSHMPSGAGLMPQGAIIDGRYRYLLWRSIGTGERTVLFLMLNPSTADAQSDDPTLRRCTTFARDWGFGRLEVCNLFALRTKDPRKLRAAKSPIGPANDRHIIEAASRASVIVAGWGTHGSYLERGREVAELLEAHRHSLCALRCTRAGHPAHPLYLPRALAPMPMTHLQSPKPA